MGKHTKGRAYDAPGRRTIYHESGELALAYGGTSQHAEANAARLAAGWNLLETLEEIEARHGDDAAFVVESAADWPALREIADAIRAALPPSTPSDRSA